MKILVLGGTRFFGREAAAMLARNGHDVTVLTRGRIPVPEGVRHLQGDRNDSEALRRAAGSEADAVIDNIAYTAAHVRAAIEAFSGRTGHYVLTSSTVVYMPAGRPPYLEAGAPELPEPPADPDMQAWWSYTAGKIEAERELFAQDRLPFTVVRPPVVIGPNDPTLRLHFYVQRVLDGGPLLLLDAGKHVFHLAGSQDLAAGFGLVLQAGSAAHGKAYNLCQRDVLSLEELVAAVAEALERKARTVAIPSALLRQIGIDYPEPLGPFPQPMICPPERACRELGFQPRPVLEAVRLAALWHAGHPAQSKGYDHRAEEIALAERYEKLSEQLKS